MTRQLIIVCCATTGGARRRLVRQRLLDAVNHGARMVAGDIVINGFKVERDS